LPELVSESVATCLSGNLDSERAAVSEDGRFIAFQSGAFDLGPLDTNGKDDIYLLDGTTGVMIIVSHNGGNNGSSYPAISAAGRHVAFESDFTGSCPSGCTQVFVYDRDADGNGILDETFAGATQTVLVSESTGASPAPANSHSSKPQLSADGRFVAFETSASNLVPQTTNNVQDIFVRDRDNDGNGLFDESFPGAVAIVRVSVPTGAGQADDKCERAVISADGRFVAYQSEAANLVSNDSNNAVDIFVHDRDVSGNGIFDQPADRLTLRVSEDVTQVAGSAARNSDGDSMRASLSNDGRYLAFRSNATDLLGSGNDPNGSIGDIFLWDRTSGALRFVSESWNPLLGGDGDSKRPRLSGDGRFVVFESDAANLFLTTEGLTHTDVYRADVDPDGDGDLFGGGLFVSRVSATCQVPNEPNEGSFRPAISADGEVVVFNSGASDLHPCDPDTLQDVYTRKGSLTLAVEAPNPSAVLKGDTVSFVAGSGVPAARAVLVVTSIASLPTYVVLPPTVRAFHGGGLYCLAGPVTEDPPISPLTVTLRLLTFDPAGDLVESNDVTVTLVATGGC
jgi:hypothetical protein